MKWQKIKKVAETSTKRPFRNFKINQPTNPKPPNAISNVESNLDDDEEEDTVLLAEEIEEDKTVECHGMWDFILLNSNNEQEALLVNTRSKSIVQPNQSNQNKNNSNPVTKEKVPAKKTPVLSPQTQPSSSNPPLS